MFLCIGRFQLLPPSHKIKKWRNCAPRAERPCELIIIGFGEMGDSQGVSKPSQTIKLQQTLHARQLHPIIVEPRIHLCICKSMPPSHKTTRVSHLSPRIPHRNNAIAMLSCVVESRESFLNSFPNTLPKSPKLENLQNQDPFCPKC